VICFIHKLYAIFLRKKGEEVISCIYDNWICSQNLSNLLLCCQLNDFNCTLIGCPHMCSIICPDDEEQNHNRSYVQMMRNKTFDVVLLTEQY